MFKVEPHPQRLTRPGMLVAFNPDLFIKAWGLQSEPYKAQTPKPKPCGCKEKKYAQNDKR